MEHTLRSVLAIVHDQPVPLLESLLLRDGPGCEHQVTQQARVLVFGCTDTLQPEPHALSASGRATALGRGSERSGGRQRRRRTVMGFFGMTRMWTGACGFTSVNASARSSSNTMLAGISLRMILPKMLSQPHGTTPGRERRRLWPAQRARKRERGGTYVSPPGAACCAAATSSDAIVRRGGWRSWRGNAVASLRCRRLPVQPRRWPRAQPARCIGAHFFALQHKSGRRGNQLGLRLRDN
jgi:hypothetical protein